MREIVHYAPYSHNMPADKRGKGTDDRTEVTCTSCQVLMSLEAWTDLSIEDFRKEMDGR